jgi:hypothetical protein
MRQELPERIVVGIFRLSSLLTRTGNRLAGTLDLTQQKWVLLAALDKHGECVLSQLGQSLLVTKANITEWWIGSSGTGWWNGGGTLPTVGCGGFD